MSIKLRRIIPPEEGWKPFSYYHVEVSVGPSNPVHPGIFWSGALNGKNGEPGGYAGIITHDPQTDYPDVFYMKVIKELISKDLYRAIPHQNLLPSDIP